MVTLKVVDVDPCGTVTLVGTPAAVLELVSETIAPPVPAAAVKVTVPVPDWPLVIVPGLTETLLNAAVTGTGLIVSANVLLTLVSDAVMVAGVDAVTLPVMTLKVVDVDPCGTTTLAGTVAAVLELESQIVQPPEPAAVVRVTVPVPDWPLTMVLGCTDMLLSAAAGVTFMENVVLLPEKDAVRVTGVVVVTEDVVTEKVADVDPCGTVTDAGTVAAALELESATTAPPVPAAALSVTVPVPD